MTITTHPISNPKIESMFKAGAHFAFSKTRRHPTVAPYIFGIKNKVEMRAAWLPKSYARYAWWIFDEPVIDHPQFPNAASTWREISDLSGRQRVYVDRLVPKDSVPEIGSDSILDARTGEIYKQNSDELFRIGNIEKKLWI